MDTTKLREALKDIEAQQTILQDAATSIRRAISALSGNLEHSTYEAAVSTFSDDSRSFIDEAVVVLELAGHELHIKALCEGMSSTRGVPVKRENVESSIIRHINKSKRPKLAKVAPSTYGLSKWKTQSQPSLVDMAQAS